MGLVDGQEDTTHSAEQVVKLCDLGLEDHRQGLRGSLDLEEFPLPDSVVLSSPFPGAQAFDVFVARLRAAEKTTLVEERSTSSDAEVKGAKDEENHGGAKASKDLGNLVSLDLSHVHLASDLLNTTEQQLETNQAQYLDQNRLLAKAAQKRQEGGKAKDFAASTKLRNEAKELTSAAESRKRELTEERHASEQHVADKGLWAGLAHLLFYSGRGYTSVRAELEAMSAMSTAGGSTRSEDIDDPIIETVDLDDIDDGTAELLAKEQEARRELEERQKNQEQRVEKAKRQTEKIETVFAQLVCALINKPHDGLSSGAPATTQDFSSNQDSSTSTPSIPPPLRQSFLNNVLPTLHVLNLTDCNLHKTSLEGLLEVISERDLPLIALCVDSNPALGDPGAMVLSQFLARRITEGKKRRITRAFWHARGREYVDDAREECEWAKFEAKKLEDPESVGGSGPQFWEVVGDWVEEDESAMLNH